MAEYVTEAKPAIIEQDNRVSVKVAVAGAVLGLVVFGVTWLLERFVLRAVLCGDASSATCTNITTIAGNVAAVLVALIGLITLVRLSVFRPLLIVLGVAISLWGMAGWLSGVNLVEQIVWSVLLYALLYSLYAWVARIRQPVVVLIVFALVAAATRVIPMIV